MSRPSWQRGEDDEDDEGGAGKDEDEEMLEQRQGDDRIIFLIDAREEMLEKNEAGESHIRDALLVAVTVLKTKIASQEKCFVGVTFFGCSVGTDGWLEYLPLEQPSAARIRQLQALVDDFDNEFPKKIGSMSNNGAGGKPILPLREALWSCSSAFALKNNVVKVNDLKRIWLFTNDDSPNAHSPLDQDQLLQVGRDCAETDIDIFIWHSSRINHEPFDMSKFYAKLIVVDDGDGGGDGDEGENGGGAGGDGGADERIVDAGTKGFSGARFEMNIRQKSTKKRAIGRGLLSLSAGDTTAAPIQIGVQFFKLFQESKPPASINLHSGTNEPTKTTTFYIDANDGSNVEDASMVTCVPVGGRVVEYSTAEKMASLQLLTAQQATSAAGSAPSSSSSSSSGAATDYSAMRLHFFTQANLVPKELTLEESIFVVPTDLQVKGSRALFANLLAQMDAKGLAAIGTYGKTEKSVPRLCLFLPQTEASLAFGLNVVPLPFRGDVRYTVNRVMEANTSDTVDSAADALVKALLLPSAAHEKMENPALRHFYSILEGIALSEPVAADSWSRGRDDQMTRSFQLAASKKDGDDDDDLDLDLLSAGVELGKALNMPKDALELMSATTKKRKAPGDGAAAAAGDGEGAKKAKKEKQQFEATAEQLAEWKDTFSEGGTGPSMTNDDLKAVCKALGVAVSGKKELLVGRIVEKLSSSS